MSTKHQWVRVKTGGGKPAMWVISAIIQREGQQVWLIAGVPFFASEIAEFGSMIPHPDEEGIPVAYLRDAHEGDGDECLVPAAKNDLGSFPVYLES